MKEFGDLKIMYSPSSRLSLNTLIASFRGRFTYNTENKDKSTKWGIGTIAIADVITELFLVLIHCFGKETYETNEVQSLDK